MMIDASMSFPLLILLFFFQGIISNASSHAPQQQQQQQAFANYDDLPFVAKSQSNRRHLPMVDRCDRQESCANSQQNLTCVKAALGRGRCLPVDCLSSTLKRYESALQQLLTRDVFDRAHITPEQLALSRATEVESDATFRRDSTSMQAILDVMSHNLTLPEGLQQELKKCHGQNKNDNNDWNNNDNHLRASENIDNNDNLLTLKQENEENNGNVMYYGFHMEGGALYDGEFSVLVAIGEDGEPNLTFIRACFGGGGVGFDVSALIGIGYTSHKEDLMGCSALMTDNELGVVLAFGIDLGLMFDGILYLDFTIGLGLTGEGLGIGLCGNWPQ